MVERENKTGEENPYHSPQHGAEPGQNRDVAAAQFLLSGGLIGLALGVLVAGILIDLLVP